MSVLFLWKNIMINFYLLICIVWELIHSPIKIVIIKLEDFNNKNSKQSFYTNKNYNKCVVIFLKYKIDWLFISINAYKWNIFLFFFCKSITVIPHCIDENVDRKRMNGIKLLGINFTLLILMFYILYYLIFWSSSVWIR